MNELFDFLIGDVIDIREEYIVVQNNNMGYRIFTSNKSMLDLEVGQKDVLIYVNLIVREDAILFYGFTSQEEVEMFDLLLLVSRIGPKVAIGVLSTLSPNRIKRAILNKQTEILCEAPGIGKKTAERMILELKDRIDESEILISEDSDIEMNDDSNNMEESIMALVTLGYGRYEIQKIIQEIDIRGMEVEDIIRETLKKLSS